MKQLFALVRRYQRRASTADSSGQAGLGIEDNPLQSDAALFGMYMNALDSALRRPEISHACADFGVSRGTLRMKMISNAAAVLGSASQEFEVYREAIAQRLAAADTGPARVTHGSAFDARNMMRTLTRSAFIAGALMTVSGAASLAFWAPMAALAEAGATLLFLAGMVWALPIFFNVDTEFQSLGTIPPGGIDLGLLRSQLMGAVSETELLAQVRTLINDVRQDRFGHAYSVVGAPGLSEVYDSTNLVTTRVADQMDDLLDRFDGASIGVAGPRGSGKSTLLHLYCDETAEDDLAEHEPLDWLLLWGYLPPRLPRELRCIVAAPVDYVARDFVLHLFATFCRAVIAGYGAHSRGVPWYFVTFFWLRQAGRLLLTLLVRAVLCGGAVLALMYWRHALARDLSVPVAWVEYAAFSVACLGAADFARVAATRIARANRRIRGKDEYALAKVARRHLSRVRYLQTYTSGWSGTLQLPWGNASGQYSRSIAQAEQPQSYPEIVNEFRDFSRMVATVAHHYHHRVFIGIDELDKIGTADQAEQFLNEIKGIFGIPHLYFMVSVSDDALNAFERRGLPLRNAFDSSFDEIMYIGTLSYEESRRLLYRRVIGLSEPFVALCHCLAGGLARDLIRAARQVVRVAAAISQMDPASVLAQELEEYGVEDSAAYVFFQHRPEQAKPTLATIAAAVIQDDLLRKLRAVSSVIASTAPASATELHDTLYQARQTLTLGQPVLHVVDLMTAASPEEAAALTRLRTDFAAYAYYCATLQEVFTDELNREHIISATTVPQGPGSFDVLANARAAFSLDTLLAWRLITQFRKTWSLKTRKPGQAPAAD
jgi:hypothetical protein